MRGRQPPRFEFYDPQTPIYTSPRFLPPAKIVKSRISDAIISHGSYLEECTVANAIVGLRSRIDKGAVIQARARRRTRAGARQGWPAARSDAALCRRSRRLMRGAACTVAVQSRATQDELSRAGGACRARCASRISLYARSTQHQHAGTAPSARHARSARRTCAGRRPGCALTRARAGGTQDAMLIGADYYESEEQRKALFEAGRIPIGIGENSVISNTIVDKNARIGKNCRIINKDGIEEANREVPALPPPALPARQTPAAPPMHRAAAGQTVQGVTRTISAGARFCSWQAQARPWLESLAQACLRPAGAGRGPAG